MTATAPRPRPPVNPERGTPLVPATRQVASPDLTPGAPEETANPSRGPDLLQERFRYCDLDEIPAESNRGEGTRVRVLKFENTPPGAVGEGWIIHAQRSLGAKQWQAAMLRVERALVWERKGSAYELLLIQGLQTGRALILTAASPSNSAQLRAVSYTDSGPPFQFEWSQLRAQVQSSRDASDFVGDGWLLVRVRGRCNFEHQGVSEGAICGVIRTTVR